MVREWIGRVVLFVGIRSRLRQRNLVPTLEFPGGNHTPITVLSSRHLQRLITDWCCRTGRSIPIGCCLISLMFFTTILQGRLVHLSHHTETTPASCLDGRLIPVPFPQAGQTAGPASSTTCQTRIRLLAWKSEWCVFPVDQFPDRSCVVRHNGSFPFAVCFPIATGVCLGTIAAVARSLATCCRYQREAHCLRSRC